MTRDLVITVDMQKQFTGEQAPVPVQTISAGVVYAPDWGWHMWGWLPPEE